MIVGLGASAGGLSAFKTFFENMPATSGMAFVLVQHLAPDHKSMLADVLGKATTMPVREAEDGLPIAANMVYVIPPDATLTCKDHILRVARPAPPRERSRPIDTFFSSLAKDQGGNTVCIVLSGTGNDGTLGLKAIKEHGGLALAQADFSRTAMGGMPRRAAATGLVDEVMPAKLLNYQHHLLMVAPPKDGDGTRKDTGEHLARITAIVRAKVGLDFSKYKKKTLVRRVQRRMQVLQIDTVPAYIARLDEEPREVELLFRELLTGVTQFFRNPDAFAALQTTAVSKLLEDKCADDQLRIRVPGCATGEEVYSIAILVKEAMERRTNVPNVLIFGTDIHDDEVSIARHGRFRRTTGLSSERLRRWFVEEGDEYCPVREVRDMCVFSIHSVVKDPPFSKLDLISCRNLLIYLDAELQDRVLRIFHYALNPHGILFLGHSEGVMRFTKAFGALDQKHRIYRRREPDAALAKLAPAPSWPAQPAATPAIVHGEDRIDRSVRRGLEKYSPAYVVDQHHQILRFSGGEAGHYLEPPSGAASVDLFGTLRKALRPVVRTAVETAGSTSEPVVREDVPIKIEGKDRLVTVIVEPIAAGGTEAGLLVVAFRDSGAGANGKQAKGPTDTSNVEVEALNHELLTTKSQLQATINELETMNEEMKSAAEEYQSVNEELQSSMRSINRERQTINVEMISKNELLTRLNSDLADKGMTFIMRIRPYRTIDNVTDGVVVSFVDISERKKAEAAATLVLAELDHRVKNILAIVTAVVGQTLKTSAAPGEFAAAIEGRIAAIARAHSLVIEKDGCNEQDRNFRRFRSGVARAYRGDLRRSDERSQPADHNSAITNRASSLSVLPQALRVAPRLASLRLAP